MNKKEISPAVIRRLPKYYRYLEELMNMNVERISSGKLSERMNLTASQIRQDLNNFGGFGQQGYGYNIKNLHDEIAKILGIDEDHNMVLIGAGHLGQALANYKNFRKRGFNIKAIIDHDSDKIGKSVGGIKVYSIDDLEKVVSKFNIEIAALCIPKNSAEKIVERLVNCDIKGIWNFAHVDIDVPENIIVENVHLSESLMRLSYKINEVNKQE